MTPANPENTCKLLLIGNASVGKSSLLIRLSGNLLPHPGSATVGIDTRIHTVKVDEKTVRLIIWDTAGAERFRTLTSAYYRGAQGVLLVYDISNRESFEELPRWFNEIETYAPEFIVKIIVGNKIDKESSREVPTSEGEAFARRMGSLFIETSAETAIGVNEAFRRIAEKVINTPEAMASATNEEDNINLNSNRSRWWRTCNC